MNLAKSYVLALPEKVRHQIISDYEFYKNTGHVSGVCPLREQASHLSCRLYGNNLDVSSCIEILAIECYKSFYRKPTQESFGSKLSHWNKQRTAS